MDDMMNDAAHYVGTAAMSVSVVQALKYIFPKINEGVAQKVVAVIVAMVTSAGLKIAMDGSLADGGKITIDWPGIQVMCAATWDMLTHTGFQLALQQFIYHGGMKQMLPVPNNAPNKLLTTE